MTMLIGILTRQGTVRGIVEKHVAIEAKKLEEISTEDLRQSVLGYLSEHGHDPFLGYQQLMFVGSKSNQIEHIAGAVEVLRERHGQDYILDMFGYRNPRTLREKVSHLFSRKYPKI